MKPSEALQLYRVDIRRIVEQHHAKNPKVFGSVIVGEDTEDSDLDLLVEPTPQTTLLDIARIQNQLQKLLYVSVDVLTPKGLPENFR
ncbi:MAG: nucleotidyltransferase [Gammaproteobacteria bacterium]|jgi:predicted nucleotidyltransferase|nr:nucleotidyltransferase [Gammaproteobacteria bacterium]